MGVGATVLGDAYVTLLVKGVFSYSMLSMRPLSSCARSNVFASTGLARSCIAVGCAGPHGK